MSIRETPSTSRCRPPRALEVQDAQGCAETPASGHAAFRHLTVENHDNQALSPDFGIAYPNRQCSASMTATPTSADIFWAP
jgi:hypothetical protein